MPLLQQRLQHRQIALFGSRLNQFTFQDFTGVGQTGEGLGTKKRLVQQFAQTLFENPQGTKQVAAVDGGDVAWFERGQSVEIIPVQQVPLVTVETGNAVHTGTQPVRHLVDGQVAAITGAENAGQPQADIGRAGTHGQTALVGNLIVVRRQPAGIGIDERREISPGPPGNLLEQKAVLFRQRLSLPPGARRQVQEPAEQRPCQPENEPGCRLRQTGRHDVPESQADQTAEDCRQGDTCHDQRFSPPGP